MGAAPEEVVTPAATEEADCALWALLRLLRPIDTMEARLDRSALLVMVVRGTKVELNRDTLEMTVGLSSLTTEEEDAAGAEELETNDRVGDVVAGLVDEVTTAPLLVTVLKLEC